MGTVSSLGYDFFSQLPKMPDADLIVQVLTRACDQVVFNWKPYGGVGAMDGVEHWFARGWPAEARLSPLQMSPVTWGLAGPGRIIVTDSMDEVTEFERHGGAGWLVPRPWNQLREVALIDGAASASIAFGLAQFIKQWRRILK